MRLTGTTYDWKLKQQVQDDPSYKNAGKLKSSAWKAAKKN